MNRDIYRFFKKKIDFLKMDVFYNIEKMEKRYKNTYRTFDDERVESYLKILLTGLPTAMAVLLGQYLTNFNSHILFSLVALLISFFIVSYVYIVKKREII